MYVLIFPQDEIIAGDIKFHQDEAHVLGKGSKGTMVYPGTLISSGKKIAVKKMFAGMFDLKEAVRLRQLEHPNIIKCFAVEKKGEFIYLALELCDKTLRRCVDENSFGRRENGIERLECLKDITRAVVYLHERKICHRDIKPDNILLSASPPLRFILADFNTARESSSSESASTQFGSIVGTNGYIAPEVFRPGEKTSVKMDIFSLGCVFYYTLTDKCHPFGSVEHLKTCQGKINHGQEPSLGDDFLECAWTKPVIKEMVSFHPKQRPSGTKVLKALEVRESHYSFCIKLMQ